MSTVTGIVVRDIRFPTSRDLDGSDAMNKDPDYSAGYCTITLDTGEEGHGFVFTTGRGTEIVTAAIQNAGEELIGLDAGELLTDLGGAWRRLVHNAHLRWLGPEKGIMHMAIGAVINALWDLCCKREGKPLWKLLSDLTPQEIVELVDFRYLTDAITPDDALAILRAAEPGKAEREATLIAEGFPAYTTTPGWLGYSDEKMLRLAREAIADGFDFIKLKVGDDLDEDRRRIALMRELVGPDFRLAIDANQRWDVGQAIEWVNALSGFGLLWIEEPTNPDDVLGHAAIARGVAPVMVATGEHAQSRVVFKQLLQAGGLHVMQIDATRVAGVNENIANILLAAKFGVPVCPHAGGVGLCEAVQHLAMFDFVAVSGSMEGRVIEYVDHLHEHFAIPTDVRRARYFPPTAPGNGMEILPASRDEFEYPNGPVWR